MIFYDETLDRYPWLEPPRNLKSEEYGKNFGKIKYPVFQVFGRASGGHV
jgi:hypothetical protein